nr:RHS repeat protein [Gemmatimonadaceae bacterium]
ERDRLQSVTRKLQGVTHFTYSGFTYDQDRRVTNASTINSATPFTFSFTDAIPSGTTAPGAPAAGTWRTDSTADDYGRPTSLLRFIDATNKQTYNFSYATAFTPRPTQLSRGYNGSATSITTFVYDDFGRLLQTTVPEAGVPGAPSPTHYEYDVASRMTLKRVGVGSAAVRTSAYFYDSLGRTTFVDHDTEHPVNCVGAANGTPIQDEEYKYDNCTGDAPNGVSCSNALGHLTISRAILQCSSGQVIKRGRWYNYDSAGRVSLVAYATVTGATIGTPALSTKVYTAASRLQGWESPLISAYGTRYTFGAANGQVTGLTTYSGGTSITSGHSYRAFGPLSGLNTAVVQPVDPSTSRELRRLVLANSYRSDDSINTIRWSLGPYSSTPTIDLLNQTMSYTAAGVLSQRNDSADTQSSRYYGYDALLRMTCEARGSGTGHPTSANCDTSSTRLAGLFTYGDGQSASSPPDVRLTSFIKGAGTATSASYTSPSTETSTYLGGSGQTQQINRTGSNIVIGYDLLGRRTFEYSTADATKSRRDYTYLPNGQLGTLAGKTSSGNPYSVVVRYDAEGHPLTITKGSLSYELFWDDADRLIAASLNNGSIRWSYHYQEQTLISATREISNAVKRFWVISDERGLPYRFMDEQGATFWQARWDATGWRQIVGTPQANMWVPFALPGQILLDGTAAFSGASTTTVRPELSLNRWRGYDPMVGAFLQPDPTDTTARSDMFTRVPGIRSRTILPV